MWNDWVWIPTVIAPKPTIEIVGFSTIPETHGQPFSRIPETQRQPTTSVVGGRTTIVGVKTTIVGDVMPPETTMQPTQPAAHDFNRGLTTNPIFANRFNGLRELP